MTFSRALAWSVFWIGLSLLVSLGVGVVYGSAAATAFLTGYAIEKALSIDNLFVFLMLFAHFGVSPKQQRKVLNYGVLGVIVLRGVLIFLGLQLVGMFEWLMYVFGAIVIYTGFVLAVGKEKGFDPKTNRILRYARKLFTVSNDHKTTRFFQNAPTTASTTAARTASGRGGRMVTPLFIVLIVVETTDLLFAVDSIPAVFAVSRDPMIVFGSNILAVLGLRSLYFMLERMHEAFRFVKKGVGVILWFVGVKMLLPILGRPELTISNVQSLATVVGILLFSILLSLAIPQKKHA